MNARRRKKKGQASAGTGPLNPSGRQETSPIHRDQGLSFRYADVSKKTPPPAVWLLLLIFVCLTAGWSIWQMKSAPPMESDEADIDVILARLEMAGKDAEGRRARGERLTVVVGTSLTQAAFFRDPQAGQMAAKMGFPKMNFLRIDQNGPLIVYRLIPLFKYILAARPDAILIENQVLTWHNQKNDSGFFKEHRRFVLSELRRFAGGSTESRVFAEPHRDAELDWQDHFEKFKDWSSAKQKERMDALHSKQELFKLKMRRDDWSGCPDSLPPELENLLANAGKQRVAVALVDIVPSQEARGVVPERYIRCQARWDRFVQEKYGASILVSPGLPLNHYMDFSHFNGDGRIAFTRWMLPELRDMLDGRAGQ